MKTTFIYALCEPGTRTVRYIGKTRSLKGRLQEHLKPASSRLKTHLGCWLKSLRVRGEVPDMIKLREVLGDGTEAEMRYIRLARGCRMDLVNSTDGGDGVTMTPETREKISERMSGKKHPHFGGAMPEKTRLAIADSNFEQKRDGASSRFIGVGWNKRYNKWRARILIPGKEYGLGYFDKEIDAALARDAAAIKIFGATALLNFMV